MQFKRLKVLMLVLFILLDIFLFNWWQAGRVTPNQVADANASIISEMRKQNIKLTRYSTTIRYKSYLAAQHADKQAITALPEDLTVTAAGDNESLVADFKTNRLIKKDDNKLVSLTPAGIAKAAGYRLNPILTANKTNGDKVYSQQLNGLPVMTDAGTMVFQYDKNDKPIRVVKRQLIHSQKLRDDRPLISEEEAIVDLYRYNEIDSGDRLSAGGLYYDKTLSVNGYDIYLPVWAFEAYSGHEKYILKINAFTGDNLST